MLSLQAGRLLVFQASSAGMQMLSLQGRIYSALKN